MTERGIVGLRNLGNTVCKHSYVASIKLLFCIFGWWWTC